MRKWLKWCFWGFADVDSSMQWAICATFAWAWVAVFGWTLRDLVIIQWLSVVLACVITACRSKRKAM